MDQFTNNIAMTPEKKKIFKALFVVFVLLAVFLGVEIINGLKGFSYIGHGVLATNVISVSGKGEVMAIPDTGTFSFSVVETAKTVGEAQNLSAKKINAIIEALKVLGIGEKDIKTTSYNSYPKYEYSSSVCTTIYPSYCPPGKQVLTGYEVSQSISVKIRKTADAGAVLTKVGSLEVTNISALDFVIDDMDAVNAEARDKAIADAKAKAKILAKSLGVSLLKIVNFEEGGSRSPIYYASMMDSKASGMGGVVPEVPVGEDTIVSNVTITYEID